MLEDAVKMLTAAFCENKRITLPVTPDVWSYHTAVLISMLTGKAEVANKGKAFIKPLKRVPADCPLPVRGANREECLFFSGVAAQMDLFLRFEGALALPTDEDIQKMQTATQRQLQFAKTKTGLFVCGDMRGFNPKFEECLDLPSFCAGLLVGACLARFDTAVFGLAMAKAEPLNSLLSLLKENGVTMLEDTENDRVVIKTLRKQRLLPRRTPKKVKAEDE